MKNIITFFLISIFLAGCSRSFDVGFKTYVNTNPQGESLTYYIGQKADSMPCDKLLVMIQGSGNESIRRRFGWGIEAAGLGYDILYMEKYAFNDSAKFYLTDCRERRVSDINCVLTYVVDSIYKGNLKEVLLFADSEGGVIAPEIAAENKFVKRMIVMGNGGLSGVEKAHLIFEKEKRTNVKGYLTNFGINKKEQLDSVLSDIKNNPVTGKSFLGHSYKYWNSFFFYDVDKYYDKLTIPIIVIAGENDMSIPNESITSLQQKFKDNKNSEFHIIQKVDHQFIDAEGNRKFPEVLKKIIYPWFKRTVN